MAIINSLRQLPLHPSRLSSANVAKFPYDGRWMSAGREGQHWLAKEERQSYDEVTEGGSAKGERRFIKATNAWEGRSWANGFGRNSFTPKLVAQSCLPFRASFTQAFSATATGQLPVIVDPEIKTAFMDLMAVSWDEIPDSVVRETKKALSKTTDDASEKEVLLNTLRAAEASVEFGSTLVSLRMALDDLAGIIGESVRHLPVGLDNAIEVAYKRYMTYLDSFSPDEGYLRKKIETELGTKMIHIKMRCSGIGSEWGKVTLLGTSGISGSYVELRA